MEGKDEKYKKICDKLGFVPSEYKCDHPATEDDTLENPFMKLTAEEIDYLYDNGYLNPK